MKRWLKTMALGAVVATAGLSLASCGAKDGVDPIKVDVNTTVDVTKQSPSYAGTYEFKKFTDGTNATYSKNIGDRVTVDVNASTVDKLAEMNYVSIIPGSSASYQYTDKNNNVIYVGDAISSNVFNTVYISNSNIDDLVARGYVTQVTNPGELYKTKQYIANFLPYNAGMVTQETFTLADNKLVADLAYFSATPQFVTDTLYDLGLIGRNTIPAAPTYRNPQNEQSFTLTEGYKIDLIVSAQNRENLVALNAITKTESVPATVEYVSLVIADNGTATFLYHNGAYTGSTTNPTVSTARENILYVATEKDNVPAIAYVRGTTLAFAKVIGTKMFITIDATDYVLTKI